ncbi:glycoside hydrolase family 73 protein [Haliscomenobacter hydrossis]|uniref:Mannosyl-glycoprotein endo-beta-N-acetylglucosamidase n=1 Tax=Haliscomenobacter hydrossis (strain ATCC 27775 / DSM 1100 / LMG 10767 / O) TaxID=760192 RepID=F4L5C5_HALH1|nr:glucosaminidase domain-containing protein [Haliscomenobacter hydrossis]AEE49805.1 Mannosyl-glycoprotein endo-beta-N-acetylglucosamidase [Haliscomenobacter hydrossis DSM 1100]
MSWSAASSLGGKYWALKNLQWTSTYPLFVLLFVSFQAFAQTPAEEKALKIAYVKKFSWLAIEEMKRTGIPASIKLAQAIVESHSGISSLATEANNHFGLKCGKDWMGQAIYKYDDDRDANGVLVESCFQAYSTIRQSYMSHSAHLSNPAKMDRYGYLFALDILDYRAWAEGLQKGGYSTNPIYANILIQTIEDLGLKELDLRVLRETGYIRP